MNCADFDVRLSDYVDRELSPEDAAAVNAHLAECVYCRSKHDDLVEALGELRAAQPVEPPGGFEAAVLMKTRMSGTESAPRGRPILVPSWVPLAIAAAVLVAVVPIGLSFLARISEHTRDIDQLRDEIAKVHPQPGPEPIREPSPAADPSDVIKEFKDSLGLVPHGNTVVPKEIADHIDRGDWYVKGEWVSKDEAAKMFRAPPPVVPDPRPIDENAIVQRWLAERKYIRAGDVWVPPGYQPKAEVVSPSEQEIVQKFMKEHDLVLQGERVVPRPAEVAIEPKAVASPEVASFLSGLRLGIPMASKGITVYPLLDDAPKANGQYRSAREALAAKELTIAETGQTFSLAVENKGSVPVFLPLGTLLVGGRFDRMSRQDTVLAPRSKTTVPVYCVQPQGFSAKSRPFTESGQYLAPLGARRAARQGLGQPAVWSAILRAAEALGIARKDSSAQDVYAATADARGERGKEFQDFFRQYPGARGVAVAVNGRIAEVEIFPNAQALWAHWDEILASAVADQALLAQGISLESDIPDEAREVKAFVEGSAFCQPRQAESGLDLYRQERLVGSLALFNRKPVSLSLFPSLEIPPTLDALISATSRILGPKLSAVAADYEALFLGSPAWQRPVILREMSALGSPRITAFIVRLLSDKDPDMKKRAALAAGDRRDFAAVPDLIKLFRDSRKDLPMLGAVARAIAGIPDDRAAVELIGSLRTLEPPAARAVLQAIPQCLLRQRRQTVEKCVTELIDYYDLSWSAAPADPKMRIELQMSASSAGEALRGLTGVDFRSPAEARVWWNRNKEPFLKGLDR